MNENPDKPSRIRIKPGMILSEVEAQGVELVKKLPHLELPLRYQNEAITECRVYEAEGKEYRVYFEGDRAAHVNVLDSDRRLREKADKIASNVNLLIRIGLVVLVGGSYVLTWYYPYFAFKTVSGLATLFLVYYFFINRSELA